ncbi:hypothetical protein LOTGIDRAFT_172857 [Lottia gigantea]|uniref:Uncharacterized protein n=1 Tax=Lottia gigantea TaxID=225164 RepID=V4AUM5_LOTGI|nr:hypothetical protein LOTGIDRAFT_172857 [Lottia gigantea]ESP01023.1 hypothetical protein LOTGIDRAFT_172857 [Lottia gigantea]
MTLTLQITAPFSNREGVYMEPSAVTAYKTCPNNPQAEIERCLNMTGIQPEADMVAGTKIIGDTQRTRRICRDGTLDKAIHCLENIFNACVDTPDIENMRKLVNVERWKTGMNVICDNLEVIIVNDKCLTDANNNSQACVLSRNIEFRTKLQAKVRSGDSSPVEIMTFSCIFADRIVDCLRKPLVELCPSNVTNAMMLVVKSFMPPICDEYWGSADSSSIFTASISLLLCGLVAVGVSW